MSEKLSDSSVNMEKSNATTVVPTKSDSDVCFAYNC